jgi:poly-gamma-glutamate synthesis protein (capsule biosynthesis protein)
MTFRPVLAIFLVPVLLCFVVSIDINIRVPLLLFGGVVKNESLSEVVNLPTSELPNLVFTEKRPESLLLVGDVLLARNVEFLMKKFGSDYPYRGVNFSDIESNSFVVGNFEASIPLRHVPTETFNTTFSVDRSYLSAAKDAGFSHFSLANNHSNDYGEMAFKHTKKELIKAELTSFGDSVELSRDSVSFITLQDREVAIVGIYTLERQPTRVEIKETFEYAKKNSDFQIAYIHWGVEYEINSSDVQKELAKKIVSAGADMIVGHHPHVVQEISLIEGVPVFYSLGNYIFDQYSTNTVQEGLILSLKLSKEPLIRLIPVTSTYTLSQPTTMKVRQKQDFFNALAIRSSPQLRQFIEYGVVPLHMQVATSSKLAIINE